MRVRLLSKKRTEPRKYCCVEAVQRRSSCGPGRLMPGGLGARWREHLHGQVVCLAVFDPIAHHLT